MTVATVTRRLHRLERPALAGGEALEVYGAPARLAEVEVAAAAGGLSTRRTGTSVAVLGATRLDGFEGERRPANLEDVLVLLTGEEIG